MKKFFVIFLSFLSAQVQAQCVVDWEDPDVIAIHKESTIPHGCCHGR